MVFYTDTAVICGIEVQKLWKPVKKSHTSYVVPFHPVFGLSGGALGVIVLLKNTLLITRLSFLQAGRLVVIQNTYPLVGIHPPLILCKFSCAISTHTPPYHEVPTTKIPLFPGPP